MILENLKTAGDQLKINGVDVFHPSTGEVRSDGADGIACWFIDTDYTSKATPALGTRAPSQPACCPRSTPISSPRA